MTEVEVGRFPNSLFTDQGRAINQQEAGWEKTLTGLPKELFEFWKQFLQPRGYRLKFQIVDWSEENQATSASRWLGARSSIASMRAILASFALGLPIVVAAQAQQPAAPTVSVITAEKRPVTESVRFVGRIQAIERVDVRARVTGFLEEVLFQDGDRVKTGAPCIASKRVRSKRQWNKPKLRRCARRRSSTTPRSSASEPKIFCVRVRDPSPLETIVSPPKRPRREDGRGGSRLEDSEINLA